MAIGGGLTRAHAGEGYARPSRAVAGPGGRNATGDAAGLPAVGGERISLFGVSKPRAPEGGLHNPDYATR